MAESFLTHLTFHRGLGFLAPKLLQVSGFYVFCVINSKVNFRNNRRLSFREEFCDRRWLKRKEARKGCY